MLESRLLHWIFRVLVSHGGSVPRHPRCAYTAAGEPWVLLHAISALVQCILRCAETHNINTSRMFLWLPSGIMSWSSHFSGTLNSFVSPLVGWNLLEQYEVLVFSTDDEFGFFKK